MFWLRPGASVRRLVFTGKYPEAAAELRIAELNEEKKTFRFLLVGGMDMDGHKL